MRFYCEKKLQILTEQLDELTSEIDNKILLAEAAIKLIVENLSAYKKQILKKGFKNESDEIYFFKQAKPALLSKLIYYNNIYKIEIKKPNGGEKVVRKYLNKEIQKLKRYFNNNREFYTYYRTKSTYLDHKYFLRGKHDVKLCLNTYYFESDHRFSTSHDYKVARIMSNDLLSVYLNSELATLDRQTSHRKNYLKEGTCCWTESKIALVELIYALQAGGCINNGTGDIKDIAILFETAFNIDLGDFYRTFLEIKVRQNPTKLLDNIRIALLKKIEEQDG